MSTMELQLTSLEFCRACRSVPTLHVRVRRYTPRIVWARREAEAQQKPWQQTALDSTINSASAAAPGQVARSRVPAVRAACLTWTLGGKALADSGGLEPWGDLKYLRLSASTSWSDLESMEWPRKLQGLVLDIRLAMPERAISWPANLQELTFGHRFNRPLNKIMWPASLRRLSFKPYFNSSVAEVLWPPILQRLSFGNQFNQAIVEVVWPASLQELSFGAAFNQPTTEVVWPPSLQR